MSQWTEKNWLDFNLRFLRNQWSVSRKLYVKLKPRVSPFKRYRSRRFSCTFRFFRGPRMIDYRNSRQKLRALAIATCKLNHERHRLPSVLNPWNLNRLASQLSKKPSLVKIGPQTTEPETKIQLGEITSDRHSIITTFTHSALVYQTYSRLADTAGKGQEHFSPHSGWTQSHRCLG